MQVEERHLNGLYQALAARDKEAPFAAVEEIEPVSKSVDREDPHEKEVVTHPAGNIRRENTTVKPGRKETEKGNRSDAHPVDGMRMKVSVIRIIPIDEDSTPDHREKHGKVDPVHPANGQKMFLLQANTWLDRTTRCFGHDVMRGITGCCVFAVRTRHSFGGSQGFTCKTTGADVICLVSPQVLNDS